MKNTYSAHEWKVSYILYHAMYKKVYEIDMEWKFFDYESLTWKALQSKS